jgi:dynein heavy chain
MVIEQYPTSYTESNNTVLT